MNKKIFRLLLIVIISWTTYYFLMYNNKVANFVLELEQVKYSYAFGYYILYGIIKWFSFVFGVLSVIFCFKIFLKKGD